MYVVYGKWESGKWVANLLDSLGIWYQMTDDSDIDHKLLQKSQNIIISPGIHPRHDIYINYGKKILSELNFLGMMLPVFGFWRNIVTIWITGTNGKSTTAWIAYNILKKNLSDHDVYLCGNFKPSLSQQISDIIQAKYSEDIDQISDRKSILVIEASSFMLYGLQNFTFDYGILTNIAPDHLNRHVDFADYQQSKLNMIRNSSHCVSIPELKTQIGNLSDRCSFLQQKKYKTNLEWAHNQTNIWLALNVVFKLFDDFDITLDENTMIQDLLDIKSLPHRFQLMYKIWNISIFDDAVCSGTDAFKSAVSNFDHKVLVIVGGAHKGEDYTVLDQIFVDKVAFGVCLGTQMASKFHAQFERLGIPSVICKDLKSAVSMSISMAQKHNLSDILFSPACASFDIFESASQRWNMFIQEVNKL